jgi:decaprenylphospho-beta-D-erythro-pentofuranosid-2-ulose 2-reductase
MNDAFGSPQSVLVLGGTSDIAQSIVRVLVSRRARTVVLAGRDRSRLESFAGDLMAQGAATVETVVFDALDATSHRSLVDDVFRRHGDIDLVLFAFGTLGDKDTVHEDPEAAAEVASVNYVGAVSLGIAVAANLRRQGHGTIVALCSVAGMRVRRDNFVYGSAKAGMDAFFQGLDHALAGSGARVMIVRPGFVRTRMTEGLRPAPFATTAEEVARQTVRGLEVQAAVVWVPPVLRSVMGLMRLLPRPVFRRIAR